MTCTGSVMRIQNAPLLHGRTDSVPHRVARLCQAHGAFAGQPQLLDCPREVVHGHPRVAVPVEELKRALLLAEPCLLHAAGRVGITFWFHSVSNL